jgi:xylitol oxidase
MAGRLTNWAGNIEFTSVDFARPASVDELCAVVGRADKVRALGTGHSFNTIADTPGTLIQLDRLAGRIDVDAERRVVRVSGATRFAELGVALQRQGFALPNLGSLPHISVAGAVATGTHGSGVGNGNVARGVRALDLVTADGEVRTFSRGDAEFDGVVLALGSLGIVTDLELDIVPTFDIEQRVYEGLTWDALFEHFDAIIASAYSVSVFTDWHEPAKLWVKRRVGDAFDEPAWPGVRPADGPRHPVPGMPVENCTEQLGAPGPWHERLPHFRIEFTPSSGDELQTEYFVDAADAVAAMRAVKELEPVIAPVLQISEIRAVAPDDYWISTAYQRPSIALHFTWSPDAADVAKALELIEPALAPFDARPHWGKVFDIAPETVAGLYPRWSDFDRLLRSLDPKGTFGNDFVERFFPR